jgi:hypothetical protein
MAYLFIKHQVEDYPSWKKVFDGFIDHRRSGGEKSYQILHPEGDPKNLLAIFEWDNLANAKKFANSEELKSTMGKAGVKSQPEVYFLEEYTKGIV